MIMLKYNLGRNKLMTNVDAVKQYAEELGYLIASSISRKVLHALKLGHETPTSLSRFLKISLSNISTKLGELKRRGLVRCVNPDRRKGRIYIITEKGKILLESLPNGYKLEFNQDYDG